MISAPSTCCTRPPARRPNAATPCSRPPSRPCAESASAPGGSARSPPPPSSYSTTSTAAPHDQQARGSFYWEWFTLLQRRTFLKLFIEKVRVLPATHRGARFSHERVELFWIC